MTRTLSNRAINKFAEDNICLPMLILSLYRPSVGVRKDWSWFVAYLQLLSWSKRHIWCCYLLDLHEFLINSLDMVLCELVGLDYPRGKGSLFSVALYCSSSEPVHGRLTSEQSQFPVLLFAYQTSSLVVASSVLHLLIATGHFSPDVIPCQQRRWCRSRWPRWPHQCSSRHHLPLLTTRPRSSSPRRAGNTVPHESLVSQSLQRTVQSMPVLSMASPI